MTTNLSNSGRTQYRIALTIARGHGARYERTAYVSDKPRWDGAWFNESKDAARIYKTRTWAEKWLVDRPVVISHSLGRVEEVR